MKKKLRGKFLLTFMKNFLSYTELVFGGISREKLLEKFMEKIQEKFLRHPMKKFLKDNLDEFLN